MIPDRLFALLRSTHFFARKLLVPIVALLSLGHGVAAEPQAAERIAVDITGIDTARGGNLVVLIFGENGFPVDHALALGTQRVPVSADRVTIELHAPDTLSEMAVKVLHDQDKNDKVTKNWTGIWPAEGLGFSNGARMHRTGPPKYDEAKITRAQALRGLAIPVVYP